MVFILRLNIVWDLRAPSHEFLLGVDRLLGLEGSCLIGNLKYDGSWSGAITAGRIRERTKYLQRELKAKEQGQRRALGQAQLVGLEATLPLLRCVVVIIIFSMP